MSPWIVYGNIYAYITYQPVLKAPNVGTSQSLTWNARGLGRPVKCRLLKSNSIAIMGILETKRESFPDRMFNSFGPHINQWLTPFCGFIWGYFGGV